ncbi:unnamed protein product (macronuclear) [Paramecium tetraurelia]|uniref:Uncharacterized protein n=1 Tax=Paramecium tetraurelia TaxID=5888 RepID=A0EIK1_PARTE|nr:uncharacterized protein GSPATT00027471001 [Paramecium tetraurelia]CAK95142.1 unnamed protein product [Paramecium tetraurelia]|eukprot:XP_001462515.1 hypothetical protein (macronuclear) [Paramecium tetraurelia strain d4-2]
MKQNNCKIKDIYSEKLIQPLYDFQKYHLKVTFNINLLQNPNKQTPPHKPLDKQIANKTVSQFYNQQAFLQKHKTNQQLLLQILQPSQHKLHKKEYPKIVVDQKNISEQNTCKVIKINSQPLVDDRKKQEKDNRKQISEVVLMQKYHTTRLIEQQDQKTNSILNKLTNNKFNKSRYSNLNFLQSINKYSKFIIFVIQKFDLFGVKHSSSFIGKNPPTYQCSFYSDQKLLYKSKPFEYNEFLESIIGFQCQEFTSIYVVIEKIKQNEQFQVGQVIYIESYSHITNTPLKENIIIKVSDEIDGEIKKTISDEQVTVGILQYKVLQLCQQNNQNKLQVPQASYAIQIQQSTPRHSATQIENNVSTQLK